MKTNSQTSDSLHYKTTWPWWKVCFKNGQLHISGHSKVLLSRHFLNLRPSDTLINPAADPNIKSAGKMSSLNADYKAPAALPAAGGDKIKLTFADRRKEAKLVFKAIFTDINFFYQAVKKTLSYPYSLLTKISWPNWRLIQPIMDWNRQRWSQLFSFLALALLLILPLKGIAIWQQLGERRVQIMNYTEVGAAAIKAGASELNQGHLAEAEQNFRSAAATFDNATGLIHSWPDKLWNLLSLIPGKPQQYASGNYLIATSREISEAAAEAVAAWRTLQTAVASNPSSLSLNLQSIKTSVEQIKYHLDQANSYLDKVDPNVVPPTLRAALITMQDELKHLTSQLSNFVTLPQFIGQAVSDNNNREKTFVFIFQNPSELRPTGGFMGSLALMKITNGQITQVNIPGGGPYDFQGQLKRTIRPPEPIRLVRGVWQLQDANWWPDFPTSAQKILWFLEQSGAPPADGVLAITANLAVDLLKLTGPIDFPSYGKVLTADNFYRTTQSAVEIEYDRRLNRPKQFIADLAPLLLNKIVNLPASKQPDLLLALEKALTERDLQIYLKSSALQSQVITYGWGGEIKQTPLDYLAVVRTNIGGGKTDLVTSEKVNHQVNIASDGTMTVELKFTRQHNGNPQDLWASRRNVDYVRFYVPRGSVLLEADGFTPPPENYYRAVPEDAEYDQDLLNHEQFVALHQPSQTRISEESGKTVFANWLSVSPGETATARLLYRLPFVLRPDSSWQDLRRYQVFFQHQAGTGPVQFSSHITLPPEWRLRWQRGSNDLTFESANKTINFNNTWLKDEYYALIVEKIHE